MADSILESLQPVVEQLKDMRPFLPTYAHLLVSALIPIYTGAHASLSRPSSAAKPTKKSRAESESEDEEEDEGKDTGNKMEGLEPSDALMFPLIAGLTLGGLYLIIKWLKDPSILNKILSFYFSQMGLFFTGALLRDGLKVLRSYVFPSTYYSGNRQWRVNQFKCLASAIENEESSDTAIHVERKSPLPGFLGAIPLPVTIQDSLWTLRALIYQKLQLRVKALHLFNIKIRYDMLDVTAAFTSLVAVTYFAFYAKPWWLTNLLGFSFCYGSLQVISPSTFTTGSLILTSLFLYDIYFVFFTPLMVTVATKLDVPIKMVFPRPAGPNEDPNELSLAMLGLGDIVVPGMIIGLALRFDLFLYYKYKSILKSRKESSAEGAEKAIYQRATGGWGERFWTRSKPSKSLSLQPPYPDAQSFPKPYFYASIVGYIIGMVATLIAMQFSHHAQPALLYLVPGVLISLWSTAYFRKELDSMWSFSDMMEDEEPKANIQEDQGREKKEAAVRSGLFARIWSGDLKSQFDNVEVHKDDEEEKESEVESLSDSQKKSDTQPGDAVPSKAEIEGEICLFSMSVSVLQKKCLIDGSGE
ncbi:signal peptide peptidase, putative [Talaromyces stipitatus ATCC 10500]|uniref:Signal peptide peptidase, putative n=1 Tax=Talaromyces stipitatus (strain ATCC 10500 / CBS 375.48 / QM 6759 / NRRL 1006) TaxID=441959 RepID=B8M4T1_TALSN|nr:signal peptide peptidase, putative [Talaromyces stipitatus ATCC 10500]EED19366.1 signal peptide peptidase, putative [Talaromyces stipitatus ATCC 10500]